jgi:activator of HSP90 ATPase
MPHPAIHQEVALAASPARVFEALTRADQFQAMSGGAPTQIEPREGGSFSCFGGVIYGRTIELVDGKRLVQAWRVKTWPEGLYSLATFALVADGAGTKIIFDHVGFPDAEEQHLAAGWHANYWEPMKKSLT